MFTMSELFSQAWDDPASAKIKYVDSRSAILYGVRALMSNNSVEFQVAYDGDFYRPMPTFMVETLMREGWRRGLCLLAVNRCNESIDDYTKSINEEREKPSPDRKRIEMLEIRVNNIREKRLTFSNQL
jgi:hypothetical protein